MPIIDLQVIFFVAVIDTIVDLMVFKLFGIKGLTTFVTVIIDFFVPTFSFWLLVQSGIPMIQQVQALADYLVFYSFNIFNFVISYAIGFIISFIVCMFTGDKPPEF